MANLLYSKKVVSEMDVHIAIYKVTTALQARTDDLVKVAKFKTATSELGQNILKYAKTGLIKLYKVEAPKEGFKLVASDQGPGITDLAQAMLDNYSSSGTLGLGLPGVKRMVDEFYIESMPEVGTKVTIILYV